jgi:hypothetical protein
LLSTVESNVMHPHARPALVKLDLA